MFRTATPHIDANTRAHTPKIREKRKNKSAIRPFCAWFTRIVCALENDHENHQHSYLCGSTRSRVHQIKGIRFVELGTFSELS